MKIIISPKAEKLFKKISTLDQIAIARKIRSIASGKQVLNEEKLRGYADIFRVRVGDYRIVYRKRPNQIYIVVLGHRRDIYKLLEHLLK